MSKQCNPSSDIKVQQSPLEISQYKRFNEEARFYARRYGTVTMCTLYEKFCSFRSNERRNYYLDQMRLEWQSQYSNSPLQTEDEINDDMAMAKATFRYYLHQINPETKTRDHLLYDTAFEIQNMINGKDLDPHLAMTLITAATQAGKTFLVIALINILLALGYVPCMIVVSLEQKSQLMDRYISGTLELKNYLLTEGYFGSQLDIFEEPIFYDSKSKSNTYCTFDENLQRCLNGSARRLIVCIHHEKHIKNLWDYLLPDSKLILFIDEAHKLGGYKKLGVSGNGDDLHGDAKYDIALQELKSQAVKIFLITATPQDIFLSEPNLYGPGIVFIPDGPKYRGIPQWKFDLIDDSNKENEEDLHAEVTDDGKRKIINIPRPFMDLMKRLSQRGPIRRIDKFGRNGYHPINVLARYQPINELQHMTLGSFRSDTKPANSDHEEIIKSNWVVMVYNQFGVRLFHESLRGETITIGTETITDMIGNGEFLFKKSCIGSVWNWLAHNGGVKRFPRLTTITYNNASEGISFGSTWTNDPITDASWHITHGYFRLGRGASSSAMEQAMGRMNGNFGDTIIPTITCTLDEKERCIKGHLLHYKWVRALSDLSLNDENMRVIDFVQDHPLFSNHIPRAFSSIPKAAKLLKKKPNPYADMENESFKRHKMARSTLEIIAPEYYDKGAIRRTRNIQRMEVEEEKQIVSQVGAPTIEMIREYGMDEYKNILKKFKKWRHASTNIAKFAQNINPEQLYTSAQFKNLCKDCGVEQTHTQRMRYGSSKGYGRIVEKIGTRYRLYPVLVYGLRNAMEYMD